VGLAEDLEKEVEEIFSEKWSKRKGYVVPDPDDPDLRLGNDGVKLEATVLYADLADSTFLVSKKKRHFAAEVIKSFLVAACRIIREKDGVIVSFDGDRVMAVYLGDRKNTEAVRSGLAINHIVKKVITPSLQSVYSSSTYEVKHAVGVDTGKLLVARTGIRNHNDLVWVGRTANIAAKLSSVRRGDYATFVTSEVYARMRDEVKLSSEGKAMWDELEWNGETIFGSRWWWKI
jgi:class 3 adenylate cyclase